MKALLLTTGALLITAVSFAQTDDTKKNAHGTTVSSTAKSTTDADNKGKVVSEVASSKSQAGLHRQNTPEAKAARAARKAERKAAKEEMKGDKKVSDDNDDALIDAKIKSKARKDSHAGSEKHEGHEKHVKHEKPEVKGGAKGGGLKHGH